MSGSDRYRRIYLGSWRVDVSIRSTVPTTPVPVAVLARSVADALDAAGAPAPASIGLILSDDAELAELNAAHMGKLGATDVLSFPLLPPEAYPPHDGRPLGAGSVDAPGAGGSGAGGSVAGGAVAGGSGPGGSAAGGSGARSVFPGSSFVLPPGARRHLGDIVVSVERAVEQAREGRGGWTSDVRWSAREELRLLAVHGTLHVCGWDHAEPAEEAAMRALERRLLGVA